MSVNLDLAFDIENGLTFSETGIAIFTGDQDPAAGVGTPAARGSIFLRTNGQLYIKSGEAPTAWNWELQAGDVNLTVISPPAGLSISGSPVQNSGTLTFALANDLAALEALSATGFAARIGADSWACRSILGTVGNVIVTNANGIAGDVVINLATVGTAGTYGSTSTIPVLTTDTFGRVVNVVNTPLSLNLDTLSDVEITSPTLGQILQYNGASWVNVPLPLGSGTVTSVAALQPTSGFTISGSPITTSGTLTFALSNDLAAVEGLTGTGLAVRTAADTWSTRSIQGTTNEIVVSNNSGVVGNPTVSIAPDPVIPGTGAITIPDGTTADRPPLPTNGMIRFNTTTNLYEAWLVDRWVNLQAFSTGGVYQINAYLGDIPPVSGTSTVPFDNTTPLSTEGTQIWTRTVTPASASSTFVVECPMTVDIGTSNRVLIVSIFRGTVNIGSALFYSTGGGRPTTLSLKVNDTPASAAPVTYSMRAGIGAGTGTWYINSTATGNNLGSALISQYEIREFAQ